MKNCNKIYHDKNCNIIVQDEFDINYVYIYILQLNKSNGTISNQLFIKENSEQEVIFNTYSDGFYTLVTLKVPLDKTKPYYYNDGDIYKNIQKVTIQELLEVNPEYSQIDPIYDYYFLTCRLKKCYLKACQDIFDLAVPITCSTKTTIPHDLIYTRDLIWSTLNVIRFMTEFDQFEEAERLLEEITSCNGICPQEETKKGCGCRR